MLVMVSGAQSLLFRGISACRCLVGRSQFFASAANTMEGKPVEQSIRQKLSTAFQPTALEVINESKMHNVPKGSETHFKVVVISDSFEGKPLIKRHRMVNEVLQNELQTGVHALSITAKTPGQWAESGQVIGDGYGSSSTSRGMDRRYFR